MSLIGLLGRAGTAFVGGAAQQVNLNIAQKQKAEAAAAASKAEMEAEKEMLRYQAELDAQAAEAEAKRVEEAESAQRDRLAGLAQREFKAVSGMETEEVPYIGYNEAGYAQVKFAPVVETGWTQEEATSFAATANPELAKKGFIQIPVPRDDGRGFKLDLRELSDTQAQGQTFGTFAEAKVAADEGLQYYDTLGVKMIPKFEPAQGGIALTYEEASEEASQSQLFKTPVEAQEYADNMISWYDSKDEYKGKYGATFETTDEGISVTIDRIEGEDEKGGVAVSEDGFDLDVNYLLKVSGKAGTDLSKGEYRDFGIASLTGQPIVRFGREQEGYVEGETHLVFRRNGVGESKVERNESFAGFIQEDFTPEIIKIIERNKDQGVAGQRAHQAMLQSFRTFINNFKDANTEVTPDNILERDIAEKHPWLFDLAKNSPALSKLLQESPIDPKAPDDPIAAANPVNMPVTVVPGQGNAKPLLPNVEKSPFVMDQEDGQGNIVPMLDQAVVNRVYKFERTSGTDAAELLKVVHNATDPSNGEVTAESIKSGYDNLLFMQSTLENQTFVDAGGFQDPSLSTDTQRQVVEALAVYPTYNDKFIALGTSLPDLTVKRAGFNVQVSKNTGRQGKYESVTGGAMPFKVVGEQLENADNMKTSIVNLRNALNAGGEAGAVLEVESLVTGAEYLFDTAIQTIEWEDGYGAEGQKIVDGIRRDFEEAKGLTGDQRANALVRVYATMLSYQLARMMDPNGRLSDEDRRTVEEAIGLKGIKATPDKLLEVAEQLEEQVDYVQARNRAYQSGNTRQIMAAHMYNNMTGGADFRSILTGIMDPITDTAGGGATPGGGGVTMSPAMQRALNMQTQQSDTSSTTTTTQDNSRTTPATRPEIPNL